MVQSHTGAVTEELQTVASPHRISLGKMASVEGTPFGTGEGVVEMKSYELIAAFITHLSQLLVGRNVEELGMKVVMSFSHWSS